MEPGTLSTVNRAGYQNSSDAGVIASNLERNGGHGSVTPKKERRLRFKRAGVVALMAAAAAGLSVAAHHWWTVGRFMESTDDAYVGGNVTVIAAKVPGFILKLNVEDNQAVRAGDLLLKLDDRDYLAALARANATVAVQESGLTNLDAQRHFQEAIVAEAQAAVAAADAEIVRTRDDRSRFEKLLETRAVSVQESQKADADYKEAVAAGEKSRATLVAAERQVAVIDSQGRQARAALQQAVADRDLARLNESYTELRAPIDGFVGNRSAEVGSYTTAGAQLISLVPAHGLWIDANFKESQLANIKPGSSATVKVDSIPGQLFGGRVVSIAPATGAQFSILPPENATGNFTKIVQRVTVRIALDESPALDQLRPGLSVVAKVDTRPAAASTQRAGL